MPDAGFSALTMVFDALQSAATAAAAADADRNAETAKLRNAVEEGLGRLCASEGTAEDLALQLTALQNVVERQEGLLRASQGTAEGLVAQLALSRADGVAAAASAESELELLRAQLEALTTAAAAGALPDSAAEPLAGPAAACVVHFETQPPEISPELSDKREALGQAQHVDPQPEHMAAPLNAQHAQQVSLHSTHTCRPHQLVGLSGTPTCVSIWH